MGQADEPNGRHLALSRASCHAVGHTGQLVPARTVLGFDAGSPCPGRPTARPATGPIMSVAPRRAARSGCED